MIDLTSIKDRLAASTPGPWHISKVYEKEIVVDIDGDEESLLTIEWDDVPVVRKPADAEFMAASRADVEALVAEVERLAAEVERLAAEVERLGT